MLNQDLNLAKRPQWQDYLWRCSHSGAANLHTCLETCLEMMQMRAAANRDPLTSHGMLPQAHRVTNRQTYVAILGANVNRGTCSPPVMGRPSRTPLVHEHLVFTNTFGAPQTV